MIDKIYQYQFVRQLTKKIKEAERALLERYNAGTIKEEEDITAQLASEIESRINEYRYRDIIIMAKVFSRSSEEKIIGADLGVILNIDNGRIQKAFLAQAKKGQYNTGYLRIGRIRLDVQCQKMLNVSSDSFIFIYTHQGIFVVPAFNYQNYYLNHKNLGRFFSDFLKCFIGDHKLINFVKRPESLLEFANHVLYLQIKEEFK
jgi:hypothetical protein